MTKKRRTSHTSQASTASTTSSSGDMYLSTRTRKSISKSRRSSAVDEKPPSRRASVAAALSLLSLPSFNEQLSAAQVANALDVHAMYKVKVDRSSRKLEYFFGEPTPVDVCISEINKEGLKAMLESKVPLCYFLYHLLDEFSSENLVRCCTSDACSFYWQLITVFLSGSRAIWKLQKEIIKKT